MVAPLQMAAKLISSIWTGEFETTRMVAVEYLTQGTLPERLGVSQAAIFSSVPELSSSSTSLSRSFSIHSTVVRKQGVHKRKRPGYTAEDIDKLTRSDQDEHRTDDCRWTPCFRHVLTDKGPSQSGAPWHEA